MAMLYFTDRLFVDANLRVGAIICAGAFFFSSFRQFTRES